MDHVQIKRLLVGLSAFTCGFAALALLLTSGCGRGDDRSRQNADHAVLRLAVTTSTHDTGLLDILVPLFEKENACRVDLIAVGTGKALKLGENGDVDVVLVHARTEEDRFMNAGHGTRREDVMYNRFELLGPPSDPAAIKGMNPVDAMQQIAASENTFVSRGDDSGTHKRERSLWNQGGSLPKSAYVESGQGMGATLVMADQMQAYTLSDSGTYQAFKEKIDLVPLAAASEQMINSYGIMTVNPNKNDQVNHELAKAFVDFMIEPETQRMISDFKIEGETLFHPLRLADSD